MKYIVYLLTVKQRTVTRLADVHASAGQRTSASGARNDRTVAREREIPDFISPDLWPPNSTDLIPVDYKF